MRASLFILALLTLMLPYGAQAQADSDPPTLPKPMQNLVDEGVQVQYIGDDLGFDAWLTIKNGQEQYFYVPRGGEGFVMGLLYDNEGKLITLRQVQKLQAGGDNSILDALASDANLSSDNDNNNNPEFKTPAEQLYADIKRSNWIALGQVDAPVIYSFIDTQCPFCHAMLNEVRTMELLEQGKLQLRLIPVGLREETSAQAAFLLAAPNPQDRLFNYIDGDINALPINMEISQSGVIRNMQIMQSWKFDVTPMSVYRAKNGKIKIVRGRPQDMKALIEDLRG